MTRITSDDLNDLKRRVQQALWDRPFVSVRMSRDGKTYVAEITYMENPPCTIAVEPTNRTGTSKARKTGPAPNATGWAKSSA